MLKVLPKIPPTSSQSDQSGFTMFEVLIAIMVTTFFVLAALQAMAINAVFKVRAEQSAQANFWIQEDLEEVRSIAADKTNGVPVNSAKCTATTMANGYAGDLKKALDDFDDSNSTDDGDGTSNSLYDVNTVDDRQLPAASSRQLVYQTFTLARTYTTDNTAPQVLKINYTVTNSSTNEQIANLYAEVIPSASFDCPQ